MEWGMIAGPHHPGRTGREGSQSTVNSKRSDGEEELLWRDGRDRRGAEVCDVPGDDELAARRFCRARQRCVLEVVELEAPRPDELGTILWHDLKMCQDPVHECARLFLAGVLGDDVVKSRQPVARQAGHVQLL